MKKLLTLLAVSAMVCGTIFMVTKRKVSEDLSSLLLKNVTALAKEEYRENMDRITSSCTITIEGEAGVSTTIEKWGMTFPITFDVNGKASITNDKGDIECRTGGNALCAPRDC